MSLCHVLEGCAPLAEIMAEDGMSIVPYGSNFDIVLYVTVYVLSLGESSKLIILSM